jgi:hypothetical protein
MTPSPPRSWLLASAALSCAVICGGCAKIEYLAADGTTVTHRATAYYPYVYRAATGDLEISQPAVQVVADAAVQLGPEAVRLGLEYLDKKTPQGESTPTGGRPP